jgi:hypothetical protein
MDSLYRITSGLPIAQAVSRRLPIAQAVNRRRPIAQAVNRRLPIAQVLNRRLPSAGSIPRSCEICGVQSDIGVGFLGVLRFPLPIFIS